MRFIMSYYYDMYINQNTPYIEIDLPWYMTLIPFLFLTEKKKISGQCAK